MVSSICLLSLLMCTHGGAARAGPARTARGASRVAMSAKKAFRPMLLDLETETKLLAAVKEKRRDTALVASLLDSLSNRDGDVRPESLVGGWALRWVPSVAALDTIGTGLHAMPGTTFEDLFLSIGTEKSKKVEANEVLRVFGPFPSVRNILSGSYAYDPSKNGRLRISFNEMIDGLGSRIAAKDGSTERVIDLATKYAGSQALILAAGSEVLVFEKVQSVREELVRLRVLKPKGEDE